MSYLRPPGAASRATPLPQRGLPGRGPRPALPRPAPACAPVKIAMKAYCAASLKSIMGLRNHMRSMRCDSTSSCWAKGTPEEGAGAASSPRSPPASASTFSPAAASRSGSEAEPFRAACCRAPREQRGGRCWRVQVPIGGVRHAPRQARRHPCTHLALKRRGQGLCGLGRPQDSQEVICGVRVLRAREALPCKVVHSARVRAAEDDRPPRQQQKVVKVVGDQAVGLVDREHYRAVPPRQRHQGLLRPRAEARGRGHTGKGEPNLFW